MISAILCAAGGGVRTGFSENKVLRPLFGSPALLYSLSALYQYADELLVVCRKQDVPFLLPLLSPYPKAKLVEGGKTRGESVYLGLKAAKGELVLIHDAARPYLSEELIEACIACTEQYGSGVCALPFTDTAAICKGDEIVSNPPRSELYTVQTPQGFYRAPLLEAYESARREGKLDLFTDESGVYGAYVGRAHIFEGARENRKLTYADDFFCEERVGFGTDTHAFAHAEEFDRGIARLNLSYIKLCGTLIPSSRELEAHSDGDVAVHALMDALLSAASLDDIGHYFPDTDETFRGADSMKLLAKVMEKIRSHGFAVQNAGISILAETPRLAPYIEQMKENLRTALQTPFVAVAAGTNEGLGYIGEGKGITAYAVVLLRQRTVIQ